MIIHSEEYYTFEKTLHMIQIMKMYYEHVGDKSAFNKIDIHRSDYNGGWGTVYPHDVCIDIINELFDSVEIFTPYSISKTDKDYSTHLDKCLSFSKKVDMKHLYKYPVNSKNTDSEYVDYIDDLFYTSYLIFIDCSTKNIPYFINLEQTEGHFGEFVIAEGIKQDCFCIIIDEEFYYSNNKEDLIEFLLQCKKIIEVEGDVE